MQQSAAFLIPGRDRVSRYIAEALNARGCYVADCTPKQADVLVLPMGMRVPPELMGELRPGQYVLGGRLGADRDALEAQGVHAVDYYQDTRLQYRNAVPSAEGAIAILLERLPTTIQNSAGLILGYGRIGTVLSNKLRLLGAHITASARKEEDIGRILSAGLRAEQTCHYVHPLNEYDYVINTVPASVFSTDDYGHLRQDCLLLELASRPGGFDEALCRAKNLCLVQAPGLPGRFSPKTAGFAIADTIVHILKLEASSCDMKP